MTPLGQDVIGKRIIQSLQNGFEEFRIQLTPNEAQGSDIVPPFRLLQEEIKELLEQKQEAQG